MRRSRVRRSRIVGASVGAALGFFFGGGTGIVGGPFVGVAGVLVFVPIGFVWGLSAGPDLTDKIRELRSK